MAKRKTAGGKVWWKWSRTFTRVAKHKDCGCLGTASSLGWRKCNASGFLYWCGVARRKVRIGPRELPRKAVRRG